jgi:hypothetical protein
MDHVHGALAYLTMFIQALTLDISNDHDVAVGEGVWHFLWSIFMQGVLGLEGVD